ncbi:MAG: hypothetical protein J4F36_09690 [Nitrosopumilaceae archaeon]|nr:hypothetical protein [Nitrosopumilaceae archaeon]
MNKEENETLPKDLIRIYSTEDEKIKEMGKLLVSDTGRQILQLLFSETLTAKQISQKTGFDIPLVKHHILRMLDLDIVRVAKITKSMKSQDMKCYAASPHAIIILPSSVTDKAKKSKMLTRSLKTIYRLTGVGIASVSTWFGSQFAQNYNSGLDSKSPPDTGDSTEIEIIDGEIFLDVLTNIPQDILLSIVATLIVLGAGLFYVSYRRKK